jgi:hypothetical protein
VSVCLFACYLSVLEGLVVLVCSDLKKLISAVDLGYQKYIRYFSCFMRYTFYLCISLEDLYKKKSCEVTVALQALRTYRSTLWRYMPPLSCYQEGHRIFEHQVVHCFVYWGSETNLFDECETTRPKHSLLICIGWTQATQYN